MSSDNRQARRARRALERKQAKELSRSVGGIASKRALPVLNALNQQPAFRAAMAAADRAIAASAGVVPGAENAVASVALLMDRDLPRLFSQEPACREGCSYCCHIFVDVTIPELARIVSHARQRMTDEQLAALSARSTSAAERAAGTDVNTYPARLPCALLVDGRCSAYDARPLACRAEHSLDVEGCRQLYETEVDTPANRNDAVARAGAMMRVGLDLKLTRAGVRGGSYELQQALAIALTTPNAFERWFAGDDVFQAARSGDGLAKGVIPDL